MYKEEWQILQKDGEHGLEQTKQKQSSPQIYEENNCSLTKQMNAIYQNITQ